MEFQDAETLGEGRSAIGISTASGFSAVNFYKDSLSATASSSAAIEIHYQTSLTDNLDISASIWNSSLLSYFIRFANYFDSNFDIGGKIQLKRQLIPKNSKRNVAVGLTILGHTFNYDKGDEQWKSVVFGIAPGIVYSRYLYEPAEYDGGRRKITLFNELRSVYAGFKTYFLFTDIRYQRLPVPDEIQLKNYPVIFDPYAGACFGNTKQYYVEAHLIFMHNPHSGDIEFGPQFGMGVRMTF